MRPAAAAAALDIDKINKLIEKYSGSLENENGIKVLYNAKKLEGEGFFSVMRNAFRNARINPKREGQINYLNESLKKAKRLMEANPDDPAVLELALLHITSAAKGITMQIKHEGNLFNSRLSTMATEILKEVNDIKELKQPPKNKPK